MTNQTLGRFPARACRRQLGSDFYDFLGVHIYVMPQG